MFTETDNTCVGKTIKEVTITDINELRSRIAIHQGIPQQVDAQAMDDTRDRQLQEIEFDVQMGIIGHIIICELIQSFAKNCVLHIENGGFYLEAEGKKIKVRTSLAYAPPCPDRHISAFSILGDRVDADANIVKDYYVQIVFCERFNLLSDAPITLYILGGLAINNLNSTKVFEKQTVKSGEIINADTIDNIISNL